MHIYFLGHVGVHRHYTQYLYSSQNIKHILVLLPRDFLCCLPSTNVAYSLISGNRIRCPTGDGPKSLCGLLWSLETCHHLLPTVLYSYGNWGHRTFILGAPPSVHQMSKFYKTTSTSHSYCEHMSTVKPATEDIQISKIFGLFVSFTILVFDTIFITLSYVQIFITVFHLPQKEAQWRPLIHVFPTSASFYSLTALTFSLCSHIGLVLTYHLKSIPSYQTFNFCPSFSQLYCPWSEDQTNLQPCPENLFLKIVLIISASFYRDLRLYQCTYINMVKVVSSASIYI